jgi:uncharacterized membrane protein
MSARKLAEWHEAGLIDAATRDRLIAYETAHARPLLLWALWGIGALAIGLGLVSVIAANWEEIPGELRLAVHLALIAGAVGTLLTREARLAARSPWAAEALAFIAAVLGLTFFGHLGQVYQTSSPLWQPLATWLALFAPLLLLTGRSWPTAAAVFFGAAWTAWDYAEASQWLDGKGTLARDLWVAALVTLPVALAPLAAFARAQSARADFWRKSEQLCVTYAVGCASIVTAIAGWDGFGRGSGVNEWASLGLSGVMMALAGIGLTGARPDSSGRMTGAILAGAGLVLPLAYAADGVTVAAALLFFLLWGGIGAAALGAQWRGVFQAAVGVIALRLVILSFELAGDLLTSGFGLILSGLMILGVALAAVRVSRRFAPDAEPSA